MSATPSDHRSAAAIATGAGELLVELRGVLDERDAHPRLRRAMGDRVSHDYIVAELARDHPDDAVLSEEGADDAARLTAERVWIVDPLDGTPRVRRVRPNRLGGARRARHRRRGGRRRGRAAGSRLDAHRRAAAQPPARISDGPPRLVVSRSRPPAIATADRPSHRRAAPAARLGGRQGDGGRARRSRHLLHIAAASTSGTPPRRSVWPPPPGLHVSRLDGSPLEYNRPDPWLPDLLICRPEYADDVLSITRRG